MPHTPILSKQILSRTDLQFKIAHNTIGVLYQGERPVRYLNPGESPSLSERLSLGELMVYVLDTSPHTITWRVSLPSSGEKYFFAAAISAKYRVTDYKRMINEKVADTEKLFTQALESMLRLISRKYTLDHHSELDTELTDEIARFDLSSKCGLELVGAPDVVITLTEEDHRRIKEIENIKRAGRVARVAEHKDSIPSKDGAYQFQVTVNVTYKVKEAEQLPSEDLDETEKLLWPRIRRALRRASQDYSLTDIARADAAMQNALDNLVDSEKLDEFGLHVLDTQVSTDLDQAMRKRYVELAEEEHKAALEKARIEGLRPSTDFYTSLIKQGAWAALAVSVSRGEISVDELYQRLTEQEQERLKVQIALLDKFRSDNMRDEAQDYEMSKILVETVTRSVVSSPGGPLHPALSSPQTAGQLPPSQPEKPAVSEE